MRLVSTIAKELLGLFVDDGSLALAVLVWVAVVAGLVEIAGLGSAVAGGTLFAGLVCILVENVLRRARRR